MSPYFYITMLFLAIAIPSALFFADWWNARHGLDGSGKPLERHPMKNNDDSV